MGVPPLENGQLPMGRGVHPGRGGRAFVDFNANSRCGPNFGQTGEDLLAALRYAVGEVAACWMAGSFLTDKAQPGDIDCVPLIDAENLDRRYAFGNSRNQTVPKTLRYR